MNGAYIIGIDIGGTNFRIGAVETDGMCRLDRSCGTDRACRLDGSYGADRACRLDGSYGADRACGLDGSCGADRVCGLDGSYGADRACGLDGRYGLHGAEASQIENIQKMQFDKIPVREVFHSSDPLKDLAQYLKEYCELLRVACGGSVKAAAIGFPATMDAERRTVIQAPNIPFMENLPVADVLERELGIPVILERDVCMAFAYDRIKYGLSDGGIQCGIYFGTGIGNVITVDGRTLTGRNGTAGELGHIPVDGSEERCGCGNTGCMENLAGGKYLVRLCRESYPGTEVERIFTEHGGDALLRQFVDRMAITAATEINILDPDCMVIGGGVPNMPDFPRDYLMERIRFHTRKPYPEKNMHIIFAEDEQDKGVVGAALYAGDKKPDEMIMPAASQSNSEI